jgi:hypothetical protein
MIIGTTTVCGTDIKDLTSGSEKKVRVQCDDCGLQSEAIYHNYTEGQKKRNFSGQTFCRKCSIKRASESNKGRPSKLKGKIKPEISGPNSPFWKGGTYISSDGYRMIYVRKYEGIPINKIKWSNYMKEHIVIMETLLQRDLTQEEVVHHINGDKLDNDIDNLLLCSSDKEHRQLHNQLEQLSMKLIQTGIIIFNPTTRQYEMADVKLRELLEHPEEDNQQPSFESNLIEGSETRLNNPDGIMKTHEREAPMGDDIVRTAKITKEIAEPENKESQG